MSALYFKYQAFDADGKVKNGELNADSEREVVRLLQGKNLTPVKIQQTKQASGLGRKRKISHTDVLDFSVMSPSP